MQKLVVYTCLFGDYSALGDPFPKGCSGFRRICFTDDPNLQSDCWEIITLEGTALGPRIESRLPKLLPHRYLGEFELSLYCDLRIRFKVSPLELVRVEPLINSPLKCFSHPERDCIYEEGEVLIEKGICSEIDVRRQMDSYRRQGYPEHNGLIAGTILLRRHNDPRLVEFAELWFSHLLHYCHRDQLSFNPISWLKGFEYDTLQGGLMDNPYLAWVPRSDVKMVPSDFDQARFAWLVPEVERSGLTARQFFIKHWDLESRPDKRYVSTLNRLANKYRSDKGDLSYNAHGYTFVYETYFSSLRQASVNLLEIGLLRHDIQARRRGGPHDDAPSLKMWLDYFEKARIVGLDIGDFSAVAPMRDVTILRGDVRASHAIQRALAAVPGDYTMIIDDASHASADQQIAFARLFPKLAPGGYYAIEDLHYQPSSPEEEEAVRTSDVLRGLESGQLIRSRYLSVKVQAQLAKSIEFIHFYDSQDRSSGRVHRDALAIIKKRDETEGRLLRDVRRARRIMRRLVRKVGGRLFRL